MKKRHITLIELILAMSLLSFITGLSGVVIYGLSRQWVAVQVKARMLSEFQAVDRIAESAFRNAIPFHWTNEDNPDSPILIFRGYSQECYFTYRHQVAGDPPTALRYMLIYQDGPDVVAEYRNTPVLPVDCHEQSINLKREVIAAGVRSLQFMYAYRDPQSGNVSFVNNWNDDDEDIPIAINMFIEWNDGTQHAWLRRTASNGFDQNYDIRKDEYEEEFRKILGKGTETSEEDEAIATENEDNTSSQNRAREPSDREGGEAPPPEEGEERPQRPNRSRMER